MDTLETIRARYSVRGYRPDPVDDATLAQVLEAARQAPTAANRQPFRLIVVHTAGREEELDAHLRAPLVRRGSARRRCDRRARARRGGASDDKPYDEVDASIVMDHLVLAATSLGLGTCWVAAFDPAATREVLGLPDDVEPIAFTPLGHPAKEAAGTSRRPLAELVKYERW